jgi:hypothetical protein
MGIVVPHKSISGKIALCIMCTTLPSSLPGGPIVLRVLLETYLRLEPGSTQVTNKWFHCRLELHGLSGWDLWKKSVEDESIKGNVQAMESNEGGDRNMVEDKGTRVCAERQQKP